jgi:serine/threonine protein kinase
MLYPSYTEYIDQISAALDKYVHLQVVQKADGEPFYYTGNFSIVFKMQDEATQKYYAVKCFTRGHAQLITQYQQISKCLGAISSPHLLSFEFLEKELFIDSKQTTDNEFACVVMEWAEGIPLMPALRKACNSADTYTLKKIYQAFITLSQWLLAQPFAHGDIKPDNLIWNCTTATLQLVDYDGCYIPNSYITQAMEQGSSGYSHPQRATQSFDKHIDDFSILVMVLSLKVLYIQPSLFAQFNNDMDILFKQADYKNWRESEVNYFIKIIAGIRGDVILPILLDLMLSTFSQEKAQVDLLGQILKNLEGKFEQEYKLFNNVTVVKDDLKTIAGIGPRIEKLFNEYGIFTFAQLADLRIEEIESILSIEGELYKNKNPETWAQQSYLCLQGKWDELNAWQQELGYK